MPRKNVSKNVAYDEGLFYEKAFGPTSVKLSQIETEGKRTRTVITLKDANGRAIEIENSHAQSRLIQYLRKPLKMSRAEITSQPLEVQSELLTKGLELRNANERASKLKFLFDSQGNCTGVATEKHKQVSWNQVRGIIEDAISKVYGKVETANGNPRVTRYRMPIDNKHVSLWAKVDAGNNRLRGRSAIRISTGIRTEFDTASGGTKVPCHNWANLWTPVKSWFNLNPKRIYSPIKTFLADLESGEEVTIPEIGMSSYDIHIKSTDLNPEAFIDVLTRVKNFSENVVTKTIVEPSLSTPMDRAEMLEILDAYSSKVGLASYVKEAIMEAVEENTVWGFSQAVSFVRTHGELRGLDNSNRDDLKLARKLENIAGEILSLAITIGEFHAKEGAFTYEKLTKEKTNPYREKREAVAQEQSVNVAS
jgi:hypothetical protein